MSDEVTKDDVIAALIDILDGQSAWHDIQHDTGLSQDRCVEIESIYHKCLKEYKETHGL